MLVQRNPTLQGTTSERGVDPRVLACVLDVLARRTDEVDLSSSFICNGGDSHKAILLRAALVAQGYNVTRESLLTAPCLGRLLSGAKQLPPPSPAPSSSASISSLDTQSNINEELSQSGLSSSSLSTTSLILSKENDARDYAAPFDDVVAKSLSGLLPTSCNTGKKFSKSPIRSSKMSGLLTEMQMSLIHETCVNPEANVIEYTERHPSAVVPSLLHAWNAVMKQECIFQGSWFVDALSADPGNPGLSPKSPRTPQSPEVWPGFSVEAASCGLDSDGKALAEITWKVHHAFIDACSLHIFLGRVRNLARGQPTAPGPSFWEWAQGLRHYQAANKKAGDDFWGRVVSQHPDAKGEFLLPAPSGPAKASSETMSFDVETADVEKAARQAHVTPAAVFYAAWGLVAATFADSDSAVFGAVLNGRNLPISRSLDTVGPLINVLPLHVRLSRGARVQEYMARLFRDLVELETYSWTEATSNGFTRQYESALSVEMGGGCHVRGQQPLAPLETRTTQQSRVPVSITVKPSRQVEIRFHTDRFRQRDMAGVAACLQQALSVVVSQPQTTVGGALQSLLLCPSHAQLMKWGNCLSVRTTRPSIAEDLVTLFEAAAEAHPDEIAVQKGDAWLSYRELDVLAGRVARQLSAMTAPGDVVCVHADRSLHWIGALWGVLRAGCTYCSLDPALPAALRETLACGAGAAVLVTCTTAQLQTCVPPSCKQAFSVEAVTCGGDADALEPCKRRASAQPWAAAYLCFTSGSTGVPKPVLCTHGSLVAFQSDPTVRLHAQPGVRIAQIMSVAFDGSIHEVFSALTYGATLVLPAGADALSPLSEVDACILTPSVARALDPDEYPRLKWVYLVGEQVPQTVSDQWSSRKEATCGATIKRLRPGSPVTIGVPNPTTRVYILNARRGLAQPGMVGRIHLAGVQVSRGYRGMPAQTAERFLPDSIVGHGETMYDSGDLGYWTEDGEVVCVGRNDRQVKLRGYRLDLNDLEIRIARDIDEVRAVAIAVRKAAPDELIAMVQPARLSLPRLRCRLADTLQRYALPSHLAAVDSFPTTPAGKVDYTAIAAADVAHTDPTRSGGLDTDTERLVAAAFVACLPATADSIALDRQRSFVELGGHSVDQIKLSRHLSQELGVSISLRTVISHPTVQALAETIDHITQSDGIRSSGQSTADLAAVTPIEEEWLEKSQLGGTSPAFNVVFMGRMNSAEVDKRRLEDAFNTVLSRHAVFRSMYHSRRAARRTRYRRILAPCYPRAQCLDRINTWAELNRPYDLRQELPVRVLLTAEQILVVMSHVVADYTTMSVFLREVTSVYRGCSLSPPRAVYPDPALWGSPLSDDVRCFWKAYLENLPSQPALLSRAPRRVSYRGTSSVFQLDKETSKMVFQQSASVHVSLQQLALAAVALALDRSVRDNTGAALDIVLGVPFMNRASSEHAETVGLFLQPLPVRIRHAWCSKNTDAFLGTVQEAAQSALAHGLPWNQLLDMMSITPDYPDHPLFDVMVTFHEPHMRQQLNMDIPSLEPCFAWSAGAKFKLLCEFMAVSESRILLRLEYDNSCLSAGEMAKFQARVVGSLRGLAQHSDIGCSDVAEGPLYGSPLDADLVLGKPLAELS